MSPVTSMISTCLAILCLFSNSFAAPRRLSLLSGLTLLDSPPPAFLFTTDPSPQCANVNQGTLLCCQDTLNGDAPAVVAAAALTGYELNPNSINGLNCEKDYETCNPGTQVCCQVDEFVDPVPLNELVSFALFCQNLL